jgi:hypothetical protein
VFRSLAEKELCGPNLIFIAISLENSLDRSAFSPNRTIKTKNKTNLDYVLKILRFYFILIFFNELRLMKIIINNKIYDVINFMTSTLFMFQFIIFVSFYNNNFN